MLECFTLYHFTNQQSVRNETDHLFKAEAHNWHIKNKMEDR